jgi:hypothetical protein
MPAFNGEEVAAKPDVNGSFFTVAPGEYPAIVRKIEDRPSTWGPYPGDFANPKRDDGKWEWVKIVPTFELINDAKTKIDKQDLTIGIFDNGRPVSPNPKNSPIFTGWFRGRLGAGTLLRAIGLMVQGENGVATLRGDTSKVFDAVVKVRTAVGLYSGDKKNYGPDETLALLKEQNGGQVPAFAQYRDLLKAYNDANGLEGETALKMKNFIVDVQPLTTQEVQDHGYYRDANGTVYLSKPAASSVPGSVANW